MFRIMVTIVLIQTIGAIFPTTAFENITECQNLECFHNSTCKVDEQSGAEQCVCKIGFQGTSCEKDSNECNLGDPCAHRGTCVNNFGSYRCDCFNGWLGEGVHCEIKDNATIERICKQGWYGDWCQDKCLNDSMCHRNQVCVEKHLPPNSSDKLKGHLCHCAPGWSDVDCTQDVDECISLKRCPKDRACMNTPGSYLCTCLPGWKGNNCSDDIDECLTNTCLHSTNCSNIPGSYACSCENGWTGVNCTVDIDECRSNPCKNRQTCNNTLGSYECHCNTGWNGTNCDVDIDECKSSSPPCLNAVTCLNTNGSYHCKCSSGWTGKNCNNDVDECMSSTCSVRQTCNNTLGSYECHCKRGWNGSKCDVDINECLASPCLNTGNCVNTNGSYYCNCTSGWQGDNCENDIDECKGNPCNGTLTCTNSLGSYSCSNGQTSATVSGNTDARKTYIIVGSVLGAFLLLCCIVAFVYIWKKKKKRNGARVSTLNGNEKFSSKNNTVSTPN